MSQNFWHDYYRSLVLNDAAPWRRDGGLLWRRGENFPKWAGYKSQAFFEGEVSGCTLSRSRSPQKLH